MTLNGEKPLANGNALSWTNGLRAYARTQRNPPYGLVRDGAGASHVKSHVAYQKQTVGERNANSEAQNYRRTTRPLVENSTERPQRKLRRGYSLPRSTTTHTEALSLVDARSERRACLVEYATGINGPRTVDLSSVHGLQQTVRNKPDILWKVRRQAHEPQRNGYVCGTEQDSLALSPGYAIPPLFFVTQAGGDDGFPAQPDVRLPEYPDTGESGDTYDAEIRGTVPQRGFIDHVSETTTPVAYDFRWTKKPKMCEACGRSIHIGVKIFGYWHRICRRDMSFKLRQAFVKWVDGQW